MTYHAIGKQRWDELPSMFTDNVIATNLDNDTNFWAYTYSFPHSYRKQVNGDPMMCTIECWISFSKSDNIFKKFLRPSTR